MALRRECVIMSFLCFVVLIIVRYVWRRYGPPDNARPSRGWHCRWWDGHAQDLAEPGFVLFGSEALVLFECCGRVELRLFLMCRLEG